MKVATQHKSLGDQQKTTENRSLAGAVEDRGQGLFLGHTSGWETLPFINLRSLIHLFRNDLWERAVIFRSRLSNLINDSYCHFFSPESTSPDPSHLSLGPPLAKDQQAAAPLSNWWLLPGGQIRPATSDLGDELPVLTQSPLISWPNLPHVRGPEPLHWENGNVYGSSFGSISITKSQEGDTGEAAGPPHPRALIWFTNPS